MVSCRQNSFNLYLELFRKHNGLLSLEKCCKFRKRVKMIFFRKMSKWKGLGKKMQGKMLRSEIAHKINKYS